MYIEIGQDSKLISMPIISTVLVFIHPFILLSVCHMSICNNTSSKCKIYMNLFTNFCFKTSSSVGIPTYYSKMTAVPPQIYNLDTVYSCMKLQNNKIYMKINNSLLLPGQEYQYIIIFVRFCYITPQALCNL